jgi:hypothetical protein
MAPKLPEADKPQRPPVQPELVAYLRKQSQLHLAMGVAADQLEQIGSVEQATREAQAARALAEHDLAVAKDELTAAKLATEAAKQEAFDQAIAIKAKAQAEADAIVNKANDHARALLESETARTTAMRQASDAAQDAVEVKLQEANANLESVNAAMAIAQEANATAQKEHDRLAKAIEALKAKFA